MWKTISNETGNAAGFAPVAGINVPPKVSFTAGGLYDAFANKSIAGEEIVCSPRTQLGRTDALAEGSESLQSFHHGGRNPRTHYRNDVAECAE
jgi:hypothetical protein